MAEIFRKRPQLSDNPMVPNEARALGRVRVILFHKYPSHILIHVGDDVRGEVRLPPLAAPFVKEEVAGALARAGISASVMEAPAGKYTTAVRKAIAADRAERAYATRVKQLASEERARASGDALKVERARVIRERSAVDDQLRDAKARLRMAKRQGASGYFLPRKVFQQLESEVRTLQEQSLQLQARAGHLRRHIRECFASELGEDDPPSYP